MNMNNREDREYTRRNNTKSEVGRKSRKKNSRKPWAVISGSVALAGAFTIGTIAGSFLPSVSAAESYSGSLSTTAVESSLVAGLPDVSDIVSSALPSVVSITNNIEVTMTSSMGGNGYGFGSRQMTSQSQTQTQTTNAYGSGVIIDEGDGYLYIVTNNHVAVYDESGNSSYYSYTASTVGLTVTFTDGTEAEATLLGADADADLAVLAVDKSTLPEDTLASIAVASIGSSDDMKIGQGVIAIGNALGMGISTTVGYVSATDREVTVEDGVTRTLMQVDAAINSGNSGGGLYNTNGELIGINSAKYSAVGVEGIGYAIPISDVLDLIENLKNGVTTNSTQTSTESGYLGIYGQDVSSEKQSYGYPAGAEVYSVTEGSPAAAAGLSIGDIITAVDGTTVTNFAELSAQIQAHSAGDTVTLTVSRASGASFVEVTLTVTLGSRNTNLS